MSAICKFELLLQPQLPDDESSCAAEAETQQGQLAAASDNS